MHDVTHERAAHPTADRFRLDRLMRNLPGTGAKLAAPQRTCGLPSAGVRYVSWLGIVVLISACGGGRSQRSNSPPPPPPPAAPVLTVGS